MALKVWSVVAAIATLLLATVVAHGAEQGGQSRLEIVSNEPNASPAHIKFYYHLRTNLHAWWQSYGQREVPPAERWRITVTEIGMGATRGIAVSVQKLDAPPVAYPGSEWRSERVFLAYPFTEHMIEPSAAVAGAAAIEFLRRSSAREPKRSMQ